MLRDKVSKRNIYVYKIYTQYIQKYMLKNKIINTI